MYHTSLAVGSNVPLFPRWERITARVCNTRPLQCLQGQNSFWPCDGRLNEELASETLRAKPEVGREEESEESEGEDESNEVEEDEDDESEDCDEESEESPLLEDSEEESEEEEESDDLLLFLPLAIPETSRKKQPLGL